MPPAPYRGQKPHIPPYILQPFPMKFNKKISNLDRVVLLVTDPLHSYLPSQQAHHFFLLLLLFFFGRFGFSDTICTHQDNRWSPVCMIGCPNDVLKTRQGSLVGSKPSISYGEQSFYLDRAKFALRPVQLIFRRTG